MSREFEGRVALVTGSASGIGRATALRFGREGAHVVLADINTEGGQETAQMVSENGVKTLFVRTDVAEEKEVQVLIEQTVQAFGALDFAHNNAGIAVESPDAMKLTADYDEDVWDRTMAVNLKGVWLCMKYELLQMQTQGNGAIVNTASLLGLLGYPGLSIYSASKHGVIGLTQAAARQYVPQKIRINAVCPGYIRSPMAERLIDFSGESVFAPSVFGAPEDVAEAVIWLCSNRSGFVNGQALVLDGGMTAF